MYEDSLTSLRLISSRLMKLNPFPEGAHFTTSSPLTTSTCAGASRFATCALPVLQAPQYINQVTQFLGLYFKKNLKGNPLNSLSLQKNLQFNEVFVTSRYHLNKCILEHPPPPLQKNHFDSLSEEKAPFEKLPLSIK